MCSIRSIFSFLFPILLSPSFSFPQEVLWEVHEGGEKDDIARSMEVFDQGDLMLAGWTFSSDQEKAEETRPDLWVTRWTSKGSLKWEKRYGTKKSSKGYAIQKCQDGGAIIVGSKTSGESGKKGPKGKNAWILKIDGSGEVQWERSFGGSARDVARCVTLSSEGGYVIGVHSRSSDGAFQKNRGSSDIWLLKIGKEGEVEWKKTFGGKDREEVRALQRTEKGGVIVTGATSSIIEGNAIKGDCDVWVLKVDENGELQWQKTFGGDGIDVGNDLTKGPNGNFFIGAVNSSHAGGDVSEHLGHEDVWILKVGPSGALLWDRVLGGSDNDHTTSIASSPDSGLVVGAITASSSEDDVSRPSHGKADHWLLKLDLSGDLVWERNYGGSKVDLARDAAPLSDGNYFLVGSSGSSDGMVSGNHGGKDLWSLKIKGTASPASKDE